MSLTAIIIRFLLLIVPLANGLRFDPEQVGFNLNENQTAIHPLDYSGEWSDHNFTASPSNWRIPFYTIMLDRFVNGNPSNDDANGTQFEHDLTQTQLRYGGDIEGLKDSLDYLQGMGIKVLYLAGSPHINVPWASDGYSPLDLTLLDHHFGNIEEWRAAITEVHKRGMYVILDNTMSTMGDLIGFEGYLNTSTPYNRGEHNALWKSERRYHDFNFGNNELATCEYPRFYGADGLEVKNLTTELVGCRDSDFDQYGEIAAFDNYPEWQRQISKFAFVQDRLREWRPDVLARIEHFSCITIAMLDIDGFRMDKGLQITVDAQAHWSDAMRNCARRHNKENFYISGEIVSGNTFGAVYIGRGKTPDEYLTNVTQAVLLTNESDSKYFIRDVGQSAFDGAAFHYTVYRHLNRFLGLDGQFAADGDPPVDWMEYWQTVLRTNDLTNANTGLFDPRHMHGVTNQDVFRWPGLYNGTQKQLLGIFVTTLLLPGIPTLYWGEEQSLYVLESTAANYVFGRSPMASSQAWGMHGCYKVGNSKYVDWPLEAPIYGCEDPSVNLDHRDPSSPVRNIIKSTYEMQENYPALKDGFSLQQLSNQTHQVFLPGSAGAPTELGLWSVERAGFAGLQELNQSIWLVYQNDNRTDPYDFDCSDPKKSLLAPFPAGETVKNLYFPFDEHTLEESTKKLDTTNPSNLQGCLSQMKLPGWGYKVFVPKSQFIAPSPVITNFIPGHDYRQITTAATGNTMHIEFHFSVPMNCTDIRDSLRINSTTADNQVARLDKDSIDCENIPDGRDPSSLYSGGVNTTWMFAADLVDVSSGVHTVTISNVSTIDGTSFTKSVDRFMLRIGQADNPIVFPTTANYSSTMLHRSPTKQLYISHKAPGADKFRYSLNFGTTYSAWEDYGNGSNTTLAPRIWTGTKLQSWQGEHVTVQYWSRLAGSSDHVQHADIDAGEHSLPRRFPHIFLHGPFNQHGFDDGLRSQMRQDKKGLWKANFMTEWPATVALNIWGMNPDGQPDQTAVYGDVDGDFVLDRIPLKSLITNTINITGAPPSPFLAYEIAMNDGDLRFSLIPVGSRWAQMALYVLLWVMPILTGFFGVWLFMKSFYQVKFNKIGITEAKSIIPLALRRKLLHHGPDMEQMSSGKEPSRWERYKSSTAAASATTLPAPLNLNDTSLPVVEVTPSRRTVLIATMEYDIEDWNIKIKIGGLGVMAQLMGKNLAHQDLIWVVPCVGGIEYPIDEPADTMKVTILGSTYEIQVQYHVLRNITYVLLDAPVFRQQTRSEPYPPRMDDLDSAVYYSAWNQCIAEAMRRFPVDLYHINDYHGAVAPLHLLPDVIPCVLSLHNAEFQGLWPMRSVKERNEVCQVYNLDPEVVGKYVQFGEVFNLLHAAASYLRVHQKGFGAVGVSAKYGKRSFARYPILWGLKEVGSLPNPDPTDTADWNKAQTKPEDIHVDPVFEAERPALKRQAQEWANLELKPDADLFVFVGRWSQQKGVDLIADVFPSVLEANPQVQLICIGPMIDLYGKFAALKLKKMMEVYPGRVYSKPEFTALPPYIFSGADFALMPSRDEPFGLVAVEFGRKGALCVGARVGGLGQMPGWWFTVESTTTKHLIHQFKIAIEGALKSKPEMRAIMRARAAKQRFPVAQWVEDLETLQGTAIKISHKLESKGGRHGSAWNAPLHSRRNSLSQAGSATPTTPGHSRRQSRAPSPDGDHHAPLPNGGLGKRKGPGHRRRKRLHKRNISTPFNHTGTGNAETDESSDEDAGYDTDEDGFTAGHSRNTSRAHSRGNSRSHSRNPSRVIEVIPPVPITTNDDRHPTIPFAPQGTSPLLNFPVHQFAPDSPHTPSSGHLLGPTLPYTDHSNSSVLSLGSVVGEKSDYKLQNVSPFFTDPNKEFTHIFETKLGKLDGKTSEDQLCIEEFLVKSEKTWYGKMRAAEMGRSPASSVFRMKRMSTTPTGSIFEEGRLSSDEDSVADEFLLGDNYAPPTGLKRILRLRIGDWPLYSILLAFGQIIAANSYQITLLTGQVGQPASKLYVVASIYLVTSAMWWLLYRRLKTVHVLALPFLFYGLAFLFIGIAPFGPSAVGRAWLQNTATAWYAIASSSGSIFFAVNFGDEGGAPVTAWVYRACVIQGTQQLYVVVLWYWGSRLTKNTTMGASGSYGSTPDSKIISIVGFVIAVLMWAVGIVLFIGLPKYYRQSPGRMPSFYTSLFRRKIILWFFVVIAIQNYFLSAPYGRNWLYLFSSQHVASYAIFLLVLLFFVIIWAALLYLFARLSTSHSWILPIFAIGLGAPRWAQMLWGTSNIGQYVPWAGGPAASAVVGRSLWLWLGVLDALQGVGFGMILLQTLTRFHVLFTLLAAQVLGSVATILARATAPNKIGPGDVFPDFSAGAAEGLGKPWFWIALLANLAVPVGFFMFFRKEQLSKP